MSRLCQEARAIDFIQFEFGDCTIDSRTYLRGFFELLQRGYLTHRILWDGLWPITDYHETRELFLTTNYLAVSWRLLS